MAARGDVENVDVQPELFDNWLKIDFDESLDKIGVFSKMKSSEYFETGEYPVIDQGERYISGFINDRNLLYKGDLPVIIFGDHTRNFKYVTHIFAVGADGTKILKPTKAFDPKFFYYYMKSLTIPSLGYSRHYKILNNIEVPLPPLPEQQRIVAKLDTLFGHLDALKTRLERIPQLIKEFRQKVLTQAVTGKLTEEWREGKELEEWQDVELKSVCKSITDGDHQAPPQVKEGIPFLVISNVSKGFFDFESITRFVPRSYFESLKDTRIPKKGDVLYTVTGSFGIPILVDFEGEFCFQRHIAILKPDNSKIISSFLQIVLSSTKIMEQARDVATGTAQLTVPLSGVRNFIASIPQLVEQQEIVRRVETLFAKADQIEAGYQKLKAKVDQLPQSLLAKAFRGELVPQLATDGDARKLLEEIKKAKGGK